MAYIPHLKFQHFIFLKNVVHEEFNNLGLDILKYSLGKFKGYFVLADMAHIFEQLIEQIKV